MTLEELGRAYRRIEEARPTVMVAPADEERMRAAVAEAARSTWAMPPRVLTSVHLPAGHAYVFRPPGPDYALPAEGLVL